jgi:hypothetical protein
MGQDELVETLSDAPEEQADESALGQLLDTALRFGEKLSLEHPGAVSLVTQIFAEQTMAIVPVAIRLPERARALWHRLCVAGWAGRAEAVHALREDLRKNLERKLWLVDKARRIAQEFVLLTGRTLPEAERLQQAENDLRQLDAEIFQRWQTLEDLEDLLASSYPLTNEHLEALGKRHTPPSAWYTENGKPF